MGAVHYTDLAIYKRLIKQARPYWLAIAGVFALGLLATPLALLTPLPLKLIVDNVLGSKPLPEIAFSLLPSFITGSKVGILIFSVVLLFVVALLVQLLQAGMSMLRAYTGAKLTLSFRTLLFHHSQRLSLMYHDSKGTIDAIYRIQYDAPSIQWVTIDGIIPLLTAVIMLISMVYIIARINWQLALVALTVSPIILLITWIYRPILRDQSHKVKKLETSALLVIQEVLTALRVVKAFGQEDREEGRYMSRSNASLTANIRLTFLESRFEIFIGLITAIGTAVVLLMGVNYIQSNSMTLGDLLLVMGYLTQLYGPLSTIGKTVAGLQASLASAERAFRVLDEELDVAERVNAKSMGRAFGKIAFQDVSFAYDKEHQVLNNISFAVDRGTRVGIAGTTGAGKTTLANLLTRFYDPTAGKIFLDGVDIRDYKLTDLRKQFAIVLQEPVLFSSSISENIAYANPAANRDEVENAAKAANIHEFIMSLPEGYATLVGERGMRLSGGERQRISLARAFLKDAPILILDEPTSSVDTATEAIIMEAMVRLMSGRTTFLITHRLNTLKDCDVLLRIDHGQLIETTPKKIFEGNPDMFNSLNRIN